MPNEREPTCPPQSILEMRGRILHTLRSCLLGNGFSEVETPILIATPALETHIDAIPAGDGYLRTSPELHMKRLLAAGLERIFQIGPCFRRGERGRLHHPEFTMLEWYRAGADYMDVLADARGLLRAVAAAVLGHGVVTHAGQRADLCGEWECLTVRDAYARWAGWDPFVRFDPDRFDLDLIEKIEPALPAGRPVVLKDYPPQAAALARCRAGDPPVAERWELYVAGVELANAFSELTDPREQRLRFAQCADERRRRGRAVYPLDEPFLAALERGLPPCGGAALGVDRLVMLLTGAATVAQARAFPDWPDH